MKRMNMTKALTMLFAAVVILALGIGQAQAAPIALAGTGPGFYFSFDIGATHYDRWILPLDDPQNYFPMTVSQGDTLDVTVTLDTPVTVPASVDLTTFTLALSGSSFPSINTATYGTTSFFNNGVAGPFDTEPTTTSSQLAVDAAFFPPNNTAFTFNSLTFDFTITDLSSAQSVTLDNATIYYTLFSPVPEPSSLLLLGSGFLGAIGVLRRKIELNA